MAKQGLYWCVCVCVNNVFVCVLCVDEASSLLSKQEKSRRQGQSEILEDVTRVRENIQQVWSKVGT